MGQLIDFGGKVLRKAKPALQEADIISLLPRLKNLKGEVIVINITQKVLADNELLSKLLREIVTIKCMGAVVLIVPDVNEQVNDFCKEVFQIDNVFNETNYVNVENQIDVINVICKRDIIDNISNILKSFNAMSLGVAGNNLDIIFPDELVNKNISVFDRENKNLVGMSEKRAKKYNIDMLEELLKTDIIPIIIPTFSTRNGKNYILESSLYGSYLSTYLSSLKYVEVYTDNQSIPTSCIYGIERFTKIVKTGNFGKTSLQMINAGIDAVKNGIQGTHIIDIKHVSLLEEFCGKSFAGLFLYDDTLGQL